MSQVVMYWGHLARIMGSVSSLCLQGPSCLPCTLSTWDWPRREPSFIRIWSWGGWRPCPTTLDSSFHPEQMQWPQTRRSRAFHSLVCSLSLPLSGPAGSSTEVQWGLWLTFPMTEYNSANAVFTGTMTITFKRSILAWIQVGSKLVGAYHGLWWEVRPTQWSLLPRVASTFILLLDGPFSSQNEVISLKMGCVFKQRNILHRMVMNYFFVTWLPTSVPVFNSIHKYLLGP